MKLELAQQYSQMIKQKVEELNSLISNAALDGVNVELTIFEVETLGSHYYPTVKPTITVSPTDIE